MVINKGGILLEIVNIKKDIRAAIKQGNLLKVKLLVDDDKKIFNMMTAFGTWLHVSATHGQLEIVKYFVESGINLEIQGGGSECTAIKSAASEGHIEIVKYLLNKGAKVEVSDPTKNPLFGAVGGGYKEIVELLVESGIDISVKYTSKSGNERDACTYAFEIGQTEIYNYLKEQTALKAIY